MPSYTAGTAYLRIAPSLRGLHSEINRELRTITPEPVVKVRIQPEWRRGTPVPIPPVGDAEVRVPVRAQVDRKSFADATAGVAMLQRNLLTLARPVAAAFAVPAVMGFTSAVIEASKAALLVPGAVAAAGIAVTTYKVGVMGLADAFKAVKDGDPEKIAEAMAKLSPAARTLVSEVVRISPAFKSMQLEVQETLLRNIGREFSALALRYLPVVRAGLTDTARWMNVFGLNTLETLRNTRQVDSVKSIFADTALAMKEVSGVGSAVSQIFLDIAKVGAEFLPSLASGFGDAAERARAFVANARDSGQLKVWIQDGINAVRDFIQIFVNLGVTISNVLNAAGMDGFLAKVLQITQGMREWSESADGVAQTRDLFSSLSDLGASLAPKIATIAATIIKVVEAVGPAIKPLAQGVTDVTAAAGPAVELFTVLAVSVLPPLGAALSFLAPVLGPIVAGFAAAAVASKVWAIAQGIGTAAVVAYNFAIRVAQVAQLAYMVLTSAGTARLIAWAAAQWLVNAAMTANPIGIVVVAIAAFVAAIVLAWHHSETFRNIVIGAWEGIKAAAAATWGWLTETVFPSFMAAVTEVGNFFVMLWQQWIVPAWEGIKTAFVIGGMIIASTWDAIVIAAKFAFVLLATVIITPLMILWNELSGLFMFGYENFIKPAWEGIQGAAQAAWDFMLPIFTAIKDWLVTHLVGAFIFYRDLAVAAWVVIQEGINTAWTFIRDNIWQPIVDFINAYLIPAGNTFRDQTNAAWEAVRAAIDVAWTYIRDTIWQPLVDFININIVPGMLFLQEQVTTQWNLIQTGIEVVWNFIRDNIWQPLVDFITVTIPNGFQTGVDAIQRLWDGIKKALRDPLQAAIDVVWNNGIVKVWNMVADLVGLGTKLSPYNLPGFAEGGPITGGKPNKDSVLIKAMPGEFMFSKSAVNAMGGTDAVAQLHALYKAGGSPRGQANMFLPGYAGGGPIAPPGRPHGTSAQAGAAATNPFALVGDLWGALTGAISAVRNVASGAGQWGAAVGGFGVKIGEAVLTSLQQKVAAFLAQFVGIGGPGGGLGGGSQASGTGQVATMMAALRAAFPGLGLISGVRPGAITATGNRSYHASGRAVDVPPSMAVFNWIRQNYPNSRELIFSPAGGAQIHNGAPHVYTGVTKSMHYDHVHWAYDDGGSARGRGFMMKDTIKPERVLSNRQTRAFEALVASQTGQSFGTRLRSDRGEPLGEATPGGGAFIGQLVVPVQPGDSVEHTIDAVMTRARHEFNSGRYGRR